MIVTEDVGVAQREAWAKNILPPVEQVRDGLWSIPVPMPDNPLRYVLVYALALDHGLALIDVGWDHEQSWQALVDGIASIGYHVSEVRYAAITHLHPDHFGLAPRLRQVSGATLAMHVADATLLGYHGPEQAREDITGWNVQLSELGAPTEVLDASRVDLVRFGEHESIDIVLGDGDPLDLPGWNLRAQWTPGHTPGHLCFVEEDRGLLFSGDHMLPRISPNISTVPGELENPLHRYLLSLEATTALGECEVLPRARVSIPRDRRSRTSVDGTSRGEAVGNRGGRCGRSRIDGLGTVAHDLLVSPVRSDVAATTSPGSPRNPRSSGCVGQAREGDRVRPFARAMESSSL